MNRKILAASCVALLASFTLASCSKKSATDIVSSPAGLQPGQNAAVVASDAMPSPTDRNTAIPWSSVPRYGEMHTNHLIYTGPGQGMAAAATNGFTPAQILQAYGVPGGGGSGTIVIVDAFDDPYALADFNAFSAQYGLPQETSTSVTASTNQHLQVVYASGRKPRFNSGWSQEADLDIEWAHAMAPNAKIVLVEAASNSGSNLYAADDVAATIAGARQCSNSWGGGESSGESGSDSHFNHAGVVYLFSSGDTGGAKDYPAASPNVVAVGGTSLYLDGSGNRSSEAVWNGTGCGPSAYEARPSFQNGVATVVGTKRGIGDVAAVADPNTGVLVRWNGNWYIFGGTSVACPVIAGMINTAGTNRGSGPAQNAAIYAGLGGPNFYDVTSGTAGAYSALAGYDFPTGVGTPKGLGGF
jgi:kumamolisin